MRAFLSLTCSPRESRSALVAWRLSCFEVNCALVVRERSCSIWVLEVGQVRVLPHGLAGYQSEHLADVSRVGLPLD